MWWRVAIVVICAGLYFTNPTPEQLEAGLRRIILDEISQQQVGGSNSGLVNFATVACQLAPEECYQVIRSSLQIEGDDMWLGKLIALTDPAGSRTVCIGAATRLWCPRFLQGWD